MRTWKSLRRRSGIALLCLFLAVTFWVGTKQHAASQAWGSFTSRQIIARTEALCLAIDPLAPLVSAQAEPHETLVKGFDWWLVEGRLPDGTEVMAVWNANTGELGSLDLTHPNELPYVSVPEGAKENLIANKQQAIAQAKGYVRASLMGRQGVQGRFRSAYFGETAWSVKGELKETPNAAPIPMDIRLDRKTGELVSLRLCANLHE